MTKQLANLDDPARLLKLRACLDAISKNGEGELNLVDSETNECKEDECVTMTTEHTLKLGLKGNEPCDRIGALDGELIVRQLVTVLVEPDGHRRGTHAGDFQWRGDGVVIVGSMAGMTNVGTHRKPVFQDCQKCHDPGHMEGHLTGRVVRAKDERLIGCAVTASYRMRFDPSEPFQNTAIWGTIEGLLVSPCGKGSDGGDPGCVEIDTFPPGPHPNPWEIAGYEFRVAQWDGSPAPSVQITTQGPFTGLNANYSTDITLPGPVSTIDITMIHWSTAPTVKAFNAAGAMVDSATMTVAGAPQTLTLAAPGIVRLHVDAPQNETLILEICT